MQFRNMPIFLKFTRFSLLVCMILVSALLLDAIVTSMRVQADELADDPIIAGIQVGADIPVYDPDSSVPSRTVFFNNNTMGTLTATVHISGTPTLTLTTSPAFDRGAETYTFTIPTGMQIINYAMSTNDISQIVTYTVVNTNSIRAMAIVSYVQDIDPPVTTLDNSPPTVITTSSNVPNVSFMGSVSDVGAGIYGVWIDDGTNIVSATLGASGDVVLQTTWLYSWSVPTANDNEYHISYWGVDNVNNEETPSVYTIIVDNVPPNTPIPVAEATANTLLFSWGGNIDIEQYEVEAYRAETTGDILLADIITNETNFTVELVPPTTGVYYARLRAYDAQHNVSGWQTSNIVAVGDAPIAFVDTYTASQGVTLHISATTGVLSNDIDPNNDPLTATLESSPEHGTIILYPDGAFVYTPTTGFSGIDAFMYTAYDGAFTSEVATTTITVDTRETFVYLPLITQPYLVSGDIKVSSTRFKDVTSFVPEVNLDFSGLQFPSVPGEMRVWAGSTEPDNWQNYENAATVSLQEDVIGAQQVHARFRRGSATTPMQTVIVFYIPNGDFVSETLDGWVVTTQSLPVGVVDGKLRLGSDSFGCINVPEDGKAVAAFNLYVPDGSGYQLHIEATIYTYDQLPPGSDGKYDAFEVHIGDNVTSYGNPNAPLNCDTERQVPVSAAFAVPTGTSTPISLENHTRFDTYYNTYTDVDMVWITKN